MNKSATTLSSDKGNFNKAEIHENTEMKKEDISLTSLLPLKEEPEKATLAQTKTVSMTNVLTSRVLSNSTLKPSASSTTSMNSGPKIQINSSPTPFLRILKPTASCVLSNKTSEETIIKDSNESSKVRLFRLGMEGKYNSYVNQYTTNTFALNKHQHMEHRDRRRAVVNKFRVNEFKWHNGEVYGSKEVILNTLRYSIIALENAIPTAFMHPAWPIQRTAWVRAIQLASTPKEFSAVLSFLEDFIKPICYVSVWREAAGHIELHRITTADSRKRSKKANKEEEEEEEEMEELNRELGLTISHSTL